MRMATLALALISGPALATPQGAPWGHDGGSGRPDCTQCHFDAEPLRQSGALKLIGLPSVLQPGATYDLTLRLDHSGLVTAGFMIGAEISGETAGVFAAKDARTEANGAALRSTLEGARQSTEQTAVWTFRWTSPSTAKGLVVFHVAANAANNDASAFGDQVFLSAFESRLAE